MSDKNHDVLGVYSYVDLLLGSVKELRSKGFESIQVFTPCPNHEVEDALDTGKEPSKVKYFTLCGAILGALVGASFTVLTSMDWPVVTSAKPIVSIPPYMIIIFECMILIGGLSTFLGLIINSRLRKNISPHLYDERFSNDKFGVLVNCSGENLEEVQSILINHGSEEIKIDGLITEDQEQEPEETPKEEPPKVEVKEEPKEEVKEEPKKEDAPPKQEAKTEAPRDDDDWTNKPATKEGGEKQAPPKVEVKEEPKEEVKEEPKKEDAPPKQEAKTEAPRDDDDWTHKPATKEGGEKQAPPKIEVKEEPKAEAPPKEEVKEEPKVEASPKEEPPKVEFKEEPKAEAPPKEERAQSPEDDKKTKMARLMKMAQKSKGEKEAKEEPKAEAPPKEEVKEEPKVEASPKEEPPKVEFKEEPKAEAPPKEEVKEEPKVEASPKVETTSQQEGPRPDLDDWEHKPAKGDKDK